MKYTFPKDGNFSDVIKAALPEILYTCDYDLTLPNNVGLKYIWENLPMKEKRIYRDETGRIVIEAIGPSGIGYHMTVSSSFASIVDVCKSIVETIKKNLSIEEVE